MSPRRRLALLTLALVAAVFALYWPVRAHGFVSYDDEVYLTTNPHVARGLDPAAIRWVFTHAHAANYHPLTWLSHMLDVELFGLDPGAHHLVSVALHALNTVLVLLLARAMLGGVFAPALAAALFGLHPLRVESVAWASERKDVLCAAFFLAALLAYLVYARAPSLARYALVLVLTALALLAKPMAVTLPCVFVLLDLWPLARLSRAQPWRAVAAGTGRRLVLEKLPLVALAALGALTTWHAQRVGGAVSGAEAVPLDLRVLNALASYGVYLRETFVPLDLAVFHPLAAIVAQDPHAELVPQASLALLLLVAAGFVAWRTRARAPWLLVGLCWFLGTLVPVIGLKQVGAQAHADRYTYLPLIGVAWCVAGALQILAALRPRARAPLALGAGAALVALFLAARSQVHVWRDTRALFEHALAVSKRNFVAHAALGAFFLRDDPARARMHLQQALTLYPLDATALTSLARLELEQGNLAAAEQHLRAARRIHDSKWVRYHFARLQLARNAPAAAVEEFRAALGLDPSLVDARFNLGQTLLALGRADEARAEFEAARALDPEHAGVANGLGVLALAEDAARAEVLFRRAVELDPDYADARNNLGVALERQGRLEEAREHYAAARALKTGARPAQ
jgi:tetratricopeptide (TPR) repeat protein